MIFFRHLQSFYFVFFCIILAQFPYSGYGQQGLLAEFYDGTNFERFVTKAYVGNIEDYWDEHPPVSGIDPHSCSIRWTGKLTPAKTANYVFSAVVDDGIRVWIDGEIIINQWYLNDMGIFNGKKELLAHHSYDIKVEYFNALREGEIKLMWAIEKPKEDQSWYEYFFGTEYQFQVIHSDFFTSPDIPKPIEKKPKETPAPKPPKVEKKQGPTTTKPKKDTKSLPEPKEVKKEVMTIAKAEKYIPKNVQFVISKSEVLESSYEELNTFAAFMLDNPSISVTIEGHTDVVGDKEKNQILSESRAEKVANYLIEKGINANRIQTIGYGGSKPLKVPAEGEYYPPNRRVVFVLGGLE